jgi:hypothetical protein
VLEIVAFFPTSCVLIVYDFIYSNSFLLYCDSEFDRDKIFASGPLSERELAIDNYIIFRKVFDEVFASKSLRYQRALGNWYINELAIEYWEDINGIIWGVHPGLGEIRFVRQTEPSPDFVHTKVTYWTNRSAEFQLVIPEVAKAVKPGFDSLNNIDWNSDFSPVKMLEFFEELFLENGCEVARTMADLTRSVLRLDPFVEEDKNGIISGIDPMTAEMVYVRQTAELRRPDTILKHPEFPPLPPFDPNSWPDINNIHMQQVVWTAITIPKDGSPVLNLFTGLDAETSKYDGIAKTVGSEILYGANYNYNHPGIHSIDRVANMFDDYLKTKPYSEHLVNLTHYLITGEPMILAALTHKPIALEKFEYFSDACYKYFGREWKAHTYRQYSDYCNLINDVNSALEAVVLAQFADFPQVHYIPIQDILSRRDATSAALKRILRYATIMGSDSNFYLDHHYHVPALSAIIKFYCEEFGIKGAEDIIHIDALYTRHTEGKKLPSFPRSKEPMTFEDLKDYAEDIGEALFEDDYGFDDELYKLRGFPKRELTTLQFFRNQFYELVGWDIPLTEAEAAAAAAAASDSNASSNSETSSSSDDLSFGDLEKLDQGLLDDMAAAELSIDSDKDSSVSESIVPKKVEPEGFVLRDGPESSTELRARLKLMLNKYMVQQDSDSDSEDTDVANKAFFNMFDYKAKLKLSSEERAANMADMVRDLPPMDEADLPDDHFDPMDLESIVSSEDLGSIRDSEIDSDSENAEGLYDDSTSSVSGLELDSQFDDTDSRVDPDDTYSDSDSSSDSK